MLEPLLRFDAFAVTSICAYLVLWLITVASASPRDLAGRGFLRMALMLAATTLAYAASSIWIFIAGWFLTRLICFQSIPALPWIALVRGSIFVAGGAILMQTAGSEAAQLAAFAALAVAALLRKGVLPFHFGAGDAFESGSLPIVSLFINSHLGAYLVIRFAIPMLPAAALQILPVMGVFALIMAVYAAVRALSEARPRRVLGLLCEGQASFVLAGLANFNMEGLTGALVYWWLVAFAATGLIMVYRALETRTTEVELPRRYLGLGVHAPRFAAFFAICGLALIGLPGTLGFAAEDLLFHGALESHPLLGIALPLATALNAITVLRLFTILFLGRRAIHVPPIPDALPAERWALTSAVIVLVGAGLTPAWVIELREPTAHWIAGLLGLS